MNLKYIFYIIKTTFTKKSVIFSACLFLFCMVCFLIILPVVSNLNVLSIWSNTALPIAQSYLILNSAIFTAILASYIFRESLDDGTELIIISKPISRTKIILSKFIAFSLMCLIINIFSLIIVLITFALPQMPMQYAWQLLFSTFLGNIVAFTTFGAIAILFTCFFNKTAVIMLNICVVILLFVIQIILMITVSTPMLLTFQEHVTTTSFSQQDKNGAERHYVIFSPSTIEASQEYDFNNIDNDKSWDTSKYWTEHIDSLDHSDLALAFNVIAQMGLVYSSVGLSNYSYLQAEDIFAFSPTFNYNIETLALDYTSNSNFDVFYGYDMDNEEQVQPDKIYFTGCYQSDNPVFYDSDNGSLKIGQVYDRKAKTKEKGYVSYTKETEELYGQAFDDIFNNIFDDKYYYGQWETIDKIGNDLFLATQENQLIFYNLLGMCMLRPYSTVDYSPSDSSIDSICDWYTEVPDFNINSAYDLNERVIQFKYWAINKAISQQQEYFDMYNKTVSEEMYVPNDVMIGHDGKTAWESFSEYNKKNKETDGYFTFMTDQYICHLLFANDGEQKYGYNSISNEYVNEVDANVSGKHDYIVSIQNNFNKMDEKYKLELYLGSERYYYPDSDTYIYNCIFEYTTTIKNDFYIYALIWLSIAVVLFAIAFLVYKDNDVK